MSIQLSTDSTPGTLLGDPNCPFEITSLVLGNLIEKQLGQAQFVCKQWLSLCKSLSALRKPINIGWAIHRIENIPSLRSQAYAYLALARELSKDQPEIATRLVQKTKGIAETLKQNNESMTSVLLDVFKIEILLNPQIACQNALSLINLVQITERKDEFLLEAIKAEVNSNLPSVEATLETMEAFYQKSQAIQLVMQAIAKTSLRYAREKALSFQVPRLKVLGLLECVKVEAFADPLSSRSSLREIKAITQREIQDQQHQNQTLKSIIEVEANIHLEDAKHTLLLINNSDAQDRSRLIIVEIEARTNPQQAEQTALTIQNLELRAVGLLLTGLDTCREQAIAIAMSHSDNEEQSNILSAMAEKELERDTEKSKALALLIPMPSIRSKTFLKILKVEVQQNLPEAKKNLDHLAPSEFAMGASYIVLREAWLDLDSAHKTLLLIPKESPLHDRANAELVAAEAQLDISQAKISILELKRDELHYVRVLIAIINGNYPETEKA